MSHGTTNGPLGSFLGIANGAIPPITAQQYANLIGQQNAYSSQQAAAVAQVQSMAAAQQAQNSQWAHLASYNPTQKPKKKFMIEGKEMDLLEFANTLFPDDCPEKTYILLKFKGE